MRKKISFAFILMACSSDPTTSTDDVVTSDTNTVDLATDLVTMDGSAPLPDAVVIDVVVDRADSASVDASVDRADVVSADATRTDVTVLDTVVALPDVVSTDVARDTVLSDSGCARPDIAIIPDRVDCSRGVMCPTGYSCLSFSGFVLQQFCGRPCTADCDCPTTQRCGSYVDKAGRHPLCVSATTPAP
jgi:hypothetical protein